MCTCHRHHLVKAARQRRTHSNPPPHPKRPTPTAPLQVVRNAFEHVYPVAQVRRGWRDVTTGYDVLFSEWRATLEVQHPGKPQSASTTTSARLHVPSVESYHRCCYAAYRSDWTHKLFVEVLPGCGSDDSQQGREHSRHRMKGNVSPPTRHVAPPCPNHTLNASFSQNKWPHALVDTGTTRVKQSRARQ